jgi:hypothetical protein
MTINGELMLEDFEYDTIFLLFGMWELRAHKLYKTQRKPMLIRKIVLGKMKFGQIGRHSKSATTILGMPKLCAFGMRAG